MQTPRNIRVHRETRQLELVWHDDAVTLLPLRAVRLECPCAVCVDEFTGRKLLKPETVPEDIAIDDIGLSGNYALRIRWSDSHDSGLFTFDRLRQLGSATA